MNKPAEVRQHVRAALAMRPRDKFTELQLFEVTRRKCPGDKLDVDEFRAALEWNLAENYVTYEFDKDADAERWWLTKAGKAKEGVK